MLSPRSLPVALCLGALLLVLLVQVASAQVGDNGGLSCANVRCRGERTCVIQAGRPVCRCPTVCTRIYQPVCGSSYRTYSNSCELRKASCQSSRPIYVIRQGKCRAVPQTESDSQEHEDYWIPQSD